MDVLHETAAQFPRRSSTIAVLIMATVLLSACASLGPRVPYPHAQVIYNDTKWCLPRSLKQALQDIAHQFGDVTVSSTKRWWWENRRKGGARKSWHRKCKAADFRVRGNSDAVVHFLKRHPGVGGYKYYIGGHYHIDAGPRRTW